jgi:hypothetical protein
MLLAGLWHGAAYTFLIWGAIHGTALVFEKVFGIDQLTRRFSSIKILWFLIVQSVVLTAWIFFRAESVDQAVDLIHDLFQGSWIAVNPQLLPGLAFAVPVLLFHLWGFSRENDWVPTAGYGVKGAWCAIMFYLILSFYGENNAFIYFQF